MKKAAFKYAFPYTLPIAAGFLVLGISYGLLMTMSGFSFWYPFFMSIFIFAGSMEFLTIDLLLSSFALLSAFLLALLVNARHLFYGVSLLDKYRGAGPKKLYMIYGLCDESFSINVGVDVPSNIDRGWFYFFVTLLNHMYWVFGSSIGALFGSLIDIKLEGLDFVMVALFVVMFLNQWMQTKDHRYSLLGLIVPFVSLLIFGDSLFLVVSMVALVVCILWMERDHR